MHFAPILVLTFYYCSICGCFSSKIKLTDDENFHGFYYFHSWIYKNLNILEPTLGSCEVPQPEDKQNMYLKMFNINNTNIYAIRLTKLI